MVDSALRQVHRLLATVVIQECPRDQRPLVLVVPFLLPLVQAELALVVLCACAQVTAAELSLTAARYLCAVVWAVLVAATFVWQAARALARAVVPVAACH